MGHKSNQPHIIKEKAWLRHNYLHKSNTRKRHLTNLVFSSKFTGTCYKSLNNGIKMGDHRSSKSWFTIFATQLYIVSHPEDHNVIFLYFPSNFLFSCYSWCLNSEPQLFISFSNCHSLSFYILQNSLFDKHLIICIIRTNQIHFLS